MGKKVIFTIGYSNRKFEEFLKILKSLKIELVVDVRRFPSSRKVPWFNKENLIKELKNYGIEYIHFPELGGFRRGGYLAFSQSKEFSNSIEKLLRITKGKRFVIMCTELLWWKCHRRYIANYLTKLGYRVLNIFDEKKIQEHKLKLQ